METHRMQHEAACYAEKMLLCEAENVKDVYIFRLELASE